MTDEKAGQILRGIQKQQQIGIIDRCPRCGMTKMKPIAVHNSLSRYADVYICDDCGMEEAIMDMAGKHIPFSNWDAIRRHEMNRKRGES